MIILSCPIHLDYISADQQPVALPCGHVFCTPCLDRLYGDARLKPCPLCNKPTKKASFLKLYIHDSSSSSPFGSPNGTPVKREGNGVRTSEIAMEGGRIRDAFKGLCSAATGDGGNSLDRTVFNTAVDATQRMATFSEKVAARSEDIELKCLAHELKDASSRFQSLLFPQFETLLSLRETIETLKSQNVHLEAKLTQRKTELDTISRKRLQQEKEKANLLMAKKLVDERIVGLEKALDATHEKWKSAEQELVVQKGLIGARDEELAKFRTWLGEHKHKAEKYKAEVRRLQDAISKMEMKKPSESASKPQFELHSVRRRPRSQPQRVADGNNIMSMIIDLDEDDTIDVDEHVGDINANVTTGLHPRKKPRIDEYHPASDLSDFPSSTASPSMIGRWKPPPIAKVVTNQDPKSAMKPKQNLSNLILPLKLDSKGQAKGICALGSRARMGKST